MRYKNEDGLMLLVGVCVTVVLAISIFNLNRFQNAGDQCLRHGYPQSNVTSNGNIYCVKKVDNTDYVVRLDELTD